MKKRIAIIGGGIAGLTAGIYAQKAGFDSTVYEQHSIVGGECTGWDRDGFHIDGCLHWLTGTKRGTELYKMWQEVGALGTVDIYQPDSFATVEMKGKTVTIHRNLSKLKAHLMEVSPEDESEIEKFCNSIEKCLDYEMPSTKPVDLMGWRDKWQVAKSMKDIAPVISQLSRISVKDYLKRFKSPVLREALKTGIHEDYSAHVLPFTFATFICGNGGRPRGGSRELAWRMEEKYRSLGGELKLHTKVKKIEINKGYAQGMVLANGRTVFADYVIPACDTRVVLDHLLQRKYHEKQLEAMYADSEKYPLFTCVYASFRVDEDLSDYPGDYVFETKNPVYFEDRILEQLAWQHYCYEPSFAPPGKSVVIIYISASFDWWKEKAHNQFEYSAAKWKLGKRLIQAMEEKFPELTDKIHLLDMATPLTYERYCSAYRGAYMSFGVTPKGKQLVHDGKIKGIKNLYMCGQWLMPPGGLPVALVTGKWAIQRISEEENLSLDVS